MRLQQERGATDDAERKILRGALDMKDKCVREVMTPLEDAYMLAETTRLTFAVVREIFEHGFSRVPVYAGARENIVGLLFVKDLIFVDPEDEVLVKDYLMVFERSLELVDAQQNLDDVLRMFKRGRGHLALVLGDARAPPSPAAPQRLFGDEADEPLVSEPSDTVARIVGLVTLEDIIEEILGDEIIDETDQFVDVDHHVPVEGRGKFDFTKLRRLDSAVVDATLSEDEVGAVTTHLVATLAKSGAAPPRQDLEALVRQAAVVDHKRRSKGGDHAEPDAADVIYARGREANFATLVPSRAVTNFEMHDPNERLVTTGALGQAQHRCGSRGVPDRGGSLDVVGRGPARQPTTESSLER